jgi:small-conductance mechanosensitive channel
MSLTVNESLRAIAGFFVLASVALGWWVHPAFFLFTAFVGLNLLQSGFSRWCPMMAILRRVGVRESRS